MTTAPPQPVYSGLVITVVGRDRLDKPFTSTFPAERLDERAKRFKAAGDTITFTSTPRPPLPGEVPLATAKTAQQEKAERVATQQKEATAKKRSGRPAVRHTKPRAARPNPVKPKAPAPAPTVSVAPVPVRVIAPLPAAGAGPATHNARPVVCLSTGAYYGSIQRAEDACNLKRTTLYENLKRNHGRGTCKGRVYDYATDEERIQRRCLRTPPPGSELINRYQGTRAKAFLVLSTGEIFPRLADLIAAKRISRHWLTKAKPGEVRHTPAGPIRLAGQDEVNAWKLEQK